MYEYDPSMGFELQQGMERLYEVVETARDWLGDDNPYVTVMERFNEVLELLIDRYDDYVNCYDPDEKEELRIEIQTTLNFVMVKLKQFSQLAKDIC